jgi:hypothetical protein
MLNKKKQKRNTSYRLEAKITLIQKKGSDDFDAAIPYNGI